MADLLSEPKKSLVIRIFVHKRPSVERRMVIAYLKLRYPIAACVFFPPYALEYGLS
jgi:hypothetical protein